MCEVQHRTPRSIRCRIPASCSKVGYGLMAVGALAAALPRGHPDRLAVLSLGWELFLGWRVS